MILVIQFLFSFFIHLFTYLFAYQFIFAKMEEPIWGALKHI